MLNQRNKKLSDCIDNVTSAMQDLGKWPTSEATRKEADDAVRNLRKTLKEESYPDFIKFMIVCSIAANMFEPYRPGVMLKGYQTPWVRLAELLE